MTTVRTRCGLVKSREYGKLLHCKRFCLKRKRVFIGVMYGHQDCVVVKHGA